MPRKKQTEPTKRETEVWELFMKENTRKEIAVQLHISPDTADGHIKKYVKKTGAKTVKEAKDKYLKQEFEKLNVVTVKTPFTKGEFYLISNYDWEARYINKEEKINGDRN